jgi:hypothetical protein
VTIQKFSNDALRLRGLLEHAEKHKVRFARDPADPATVSHRFVPGSGRRGIDAQEASSLVAAVETFMSHHEILRVVDEMAAKKQLSVASAERMHALLDSPLTKSRQKRAASKMPASLARPYQAPRVALQPAPKRENLPAAMTPMLDRSSRDGKTSLYESYVATRTKLATLATGAKSADCFKSMTSQLRRLDTAFADFRALAGDGTKLERDPGLLEMYAQNFRQALFSSLIATGLPQAKAIAKVGGWEGDPLDPLL